MLFVLGYGEAGAKQGELNITKKVMIELSAQ